MTGSLLRSTLPEFHVIGEAKPEHSVVSLHCQRQGCGGGFNVDGALLLRGQETAPCPWCFKVSRLPA